MKKIIALAASLCILPLAHANNVHVVNNTNKALGFEVNGYCTEKLVKPGKEALWSEEMFVDACGGDECTTNVYLNKCPSSKTAAIITSTEAGKNVGYATANHVKLDVQFANGTTELVFSNDSN